MRSISLPVFVLAFTLPLTFFANAKPVECPIVESKSTVHLSSCSGVGLVGGPLSRTYFKCSSGLPKCCYTAGNIVFGNPKLRYGRVHKGWCDEREDEQSEQPECAPPISELAKKARQSCPAGRDRFTETLNDPDTCGYGYTCEYCEGPSKNSYPECTGQSCETDSSGKCTEPNEPQLPEIPESEPEPSPEREEQSEEEPESESEPEEKPEPDPQPSPRPEKPRSNPKPKPAAQPDNQDWGDERTVQVPGSAGGGGSGSDGSSDGASELDLSPVVDAIDEHKKSAHDDQERLLCHLGGNVSGCESDYETSLTDDKRKQLASSFSERFSTAIRSAQFYKDVERVKSSFSNQGANACFFKMSVKIDYYKTSTSFSFLCEFLQKIEPLFVWFFRFFWVFVSIRVFLRA